MENQNENADSLNGENDTEVFETEDVNALKEKITEISGKNKQIFERAKKAEADAKELREKLKSFDKPEATLKPQSNEPDYAKLAFLEQRGINHPDNQKFVQDEANRLKMPLTDILGMDYVKDKLKAMNNERDALEAIPQGTSGSGGKTQNTVDYWLQKGKLPPDQKLAEQVIDAKLKKSGDNRMFDEIVDE